MKDTFGIARKAASCVRSYLMWIKKNKIQVLHQYGIIIIKNASNTLMDKILTCNYLYKFNIYTLITYWSTRMFERILDCLSALALFDKTVCTGFIISYFL